MTGTRQIRVLLCMANERKPRIASMEVEDRLDEGMQYSYLNADNVIGQDGVTTCMQVRGLAGGPVFDPPCYCYHRDTFLMDGSPINGPIQNWQRQVLGRIGHPWAGNVVIVKSTRRLGRWGSDRYVDITQNDVKKLRLFFANYAKDF